MYRHPSARARAASLHPDEADMHEEKEPRIDSINDARPAGAHDEASFPVFVTAVLSIFFIVLLVWLFVPGRLREVRALEIQRRASPQQIEAGEAAVESNEPSDETGVAE